VADPTSEDYYGYNFDEIHTDFEYIGVASNLGGGWTLDNKVYTYGYWHRGHNGLDPNGPTPDGTGYSATDVPGQLLTNDYRSWGDTLKFQGDYGFGDIQTGLWFDRQLNFRALAQTDETLGDALDPGGIGNPLIDAFLGNRLLDQTLTTLQPFVQVDWKPLPGLTLSPGVRYDHFERAVDADVNVKSGAPQSYENDFSSALPSFLAHYAITDHWAAYAQVAKGFLAPNENFFNYQVPGSTNLAPQQTWNYQAGTTWQTRRLSISGDIYYIDFANEIASETIGPNTVFFNQGGTTYKGVEVEGTYFIGSGFSVYANGSVNSAKDKATGLWVPNAPDGTFAAGVIFNAEGWYASLIDKWVGRTYGDVGEAQEIGAYNVLNGALGYTFAQGPSWLHGASIKLDFSNLLNNTRIDALAGYTAGGTTQYPGGVPLYWTIPERSVMATLAWPL